MNRIILARLALVLLTLGLGTACKESPSVGTVRAELERQIPGAEFEREFHLKLGGVSLGLAKKLARLGLDGDDPELDMLRAVKRVDIGSYRVVSLPPIDQLDTPPGLIRQLSAEGWDLLVREQSEGERTWVFLRSGEKGSISSVYVIVLDEIELTMVAVDGRLDEIIAKAIADDPDGFISVFGS